MLTWEKNPRGTRVFKTRVPPFYFSSSFLCLFVFCVLLCRWCSSSSLHLVFFSSQIAQRRWCSSSSLHPLFFSSQIAYPASLRSFFRSSVGSCLLLRSSFFFFSWVLSFFGFFLLFLGLYIFCSLFEIECKKLEIYVCIIMSNSTNSASGKHVSEARDWYGTRVFKTWDTSLQFSFKPILTYYILSLHNVCLQISPAKQANC